MDIVRRIRDNVHGTIKVTAIEDKVLSHPFFQRLRRIKQLAFLQYVFPCASHSRFEHSLGVMHLASESWEKLYENQKSLARQASKFVKFEEQERLGDVQRLGFLSPTFEKMEDIFGSPQLEQLLRLAALLHDTGHSPFSHSGELFLPTWDECYAKSKTFPGYLNKYIDGKYRDLKQRKVNTGTQRVRHELFTVLMVDRILTDISSSKAGNTSLSIDPQDVACLIVPEVELSVSSPLKKHKVHRLCTHMISGELDVDRMDYLLRDSRECGVVYGIFDESRILNSLSFYWDERQQDFNLAIQFSGLAAFEDYLRARHSMYLQLYFHKTSVAAEAMIKRTSKLLGQWSLPLDIDAYAKIDEHSFASVLEGVADSRLNDASERKGFSELVRNLIFERKLWKRVFEVTSNLKSSVSNEALIEAATVMDSLKIPYEIVSSSSSLTRLRPQGEQQNSKLTLIKKDQHQFPRVVAIEDHLSLIDANSQVSIYRIYVPEDEAAKASAAIRGLAGV